MYLKFQTKQNKEDIHDMKDDFIRENEANERRLTEVYNLIRESQSEIVAVLNEIKREFVSAHTCNIRHEER